MKSLLVALALLLFASPRTSHGEIQLPAIFGDHMALQGGAKVPFWGTAEPGEHLTLKLGNISNETTADANGKWRVDLPSLPSAGKPGDLIITGKTQTVTFTDVIVGQVWLCSGQSNMAFPMAPDLVGFGGAHNADSVLPQANDPEMRLFLVEKRTALEPATNVDGHWARCTPETAAKFSAVGYFFGRELRRHLGQPVGLIGSYWGGTRAQSWTSLTALKENPALARYAEDQQKISDNFAQATSSYAQKQSGFKADLAAWKKQYGEAYEKEIAAWNEAVKESAKLNQPRPPKPKPDQPKPKPPVSPDGGMRSPSALFNGMIAPLIPYAIKGVIWYQGEGNTGAAAEYAELFPALIRDWRSRWGEGDFPFLFVQLAGFKASPIQNWPLLRESQFKSLKVPGTGLATAVDLGDPHNIHPADKEDVARRLCLVARREAYHEDVVSMGPVYRSMQAGEGSITLSFETSHVPLAIGHAPWIAPGAPAQPTGTLAGFVVAGADRKWVPADAKIVDQQVVVSSPQVPQPVAVRYDWDWAPQGNLYNKEGLPALPFRTDVWEDPKEKAATPANQPDETKSDD